MTSGNEMAPTRRSRRQAVASRAVAPVATVAPRPTPRAKAPAPRWSRRRDVMAVFAAFAVIGFAAAYVGPTGMALAGAQAEEPDSVSLYASSQDDNQSYIAGFEAGKEAAAHDLDRANYSVYIKPKPTPTPTPVAEAGSDGGTPAAASRPLYTGGGSKNEWMTAAGIAESDWGYVDYIVKRESGWNPNATNRSSGACGLIQAYPCSKVPGNGYNPVDNLRWGNGYAVGRYGSWSAAYDFWTSNHWW